LVSISSTSLVLNAHLSGRKDARVAKDATSEIAMAMLRDRHPHGAASQDALKVFLSIA
jgi:hypothetical protein